MPAPGGSSTGSNPGLVSAATAHRLRWVFGLAVCLAAVRIRLEAVITYGRVIHEFDPWFNFRATQYLVDHGYPKFSEWFDTMSWSPIGRPVGSTVYPGLMLTAAWIHRAINACGLLVSLNDVCVFIPAGFGLLSSLFVGGIGYECSDQNVDVALLASFIMAIIPAHLMRSVAGGYDNESVAVCLICSSFYFWVRSLRYNTSWPWAILAGLSYGFMSATWGAYTFVLNMIGFHVAVLVLCGRFSRKLHKAYSLFFIIGTAMALQVPIVGDAPFKSLEQLGPMAVFFGMQVFLMLDLFRQQWNMSQGQFYRLLYQVAMFGAVVAIFLAWILSSSGEVWGMSVRVRALFIRHTKTGNPLVDSVAEHRSTSAGAYITYFHFAFFLTPFGIVRAMMRPTDAKVFQILLCVTAGYFSMKMVRLILMLAPAAAVSSALAVEAVLSWSVAIVLRDFEGESSPEVVDSAGLTSAESKTVLQSQGQGKTPNALKEQRTAQQAKGEADIIDRPVKAGADPRKRAQNLQGKAGDQSQLDHFLEDLSQSPDQERMVAMVITGMVLMFGFNFIQHSFKISTNLSEPQIMMKTKGQDGRIVLLDDFREAYWHLRDNTPTDARVMAWWDYGYQITGIANRTSIADGNTWNHEHIALLGKCLVTSEERSHPIVRHLADYVLVWSTRYAGMWGDDVAKMPHMARIAGSVYPDIDPSEYFMSRDRDHTPSDRMKESLLFQLHSYRLDSAVRKPKLFEEVFTSEHNMVRIYKVKDVDLESKHHPFGEYPPALQDVIAEAQPFKQST